MKGSDDKLNSNDNTRFHFPRYGDKDQLGQKHPAANGKRIIYFLKPLANYGDENEEDGNRAEKNQRYHDHNSQQGEQQSSLDKEKIRARNNLLRQFFPDILKAIGNKNIFRNLENLKKVIKKFIDFLIPNKMKIFYFIRLLDFDLYLK